MNTLPQPAELAEKLIAKLADLKAKGMSDLGLYKITPAFLKLPVSRVSVNCALEFIKQVPTTYLQQRPEPKDFEETKWAFVRKLYDEFPDR